MNLKTALTFAMITFVVQLVAAVVTLLYGVQTVLPEIVNYSYPLYIALPFLKRLVWLSGDALAIYYLFVVAAIVVSLVWLFLRNFKGYANELRGRGKSREHSAIFDLCGLTFAILFFDFTYVLIISLFGIDPYDATSESTLWQLLFELANASVWEEIIVRILMIGLPLLIVDLYRRNRRKTHSYVLGGGFTLGLPEVALILVSSAVFGLAHYEGWGAWKVFPAAVAGVAFGYMFLKHGLASAIILHIGFNYMSMPSEVFDGSIIVLAMTGLGVLLWIALGSVFLIYYCSRMAEFVTRKMYFEPTIRYVPTAFMPTPRGMNYTEAQRAPYAQGPTQYAAHTPPVQGTLVNTGWPGGFFLCPYCGHTDARWLDGKFQCLRCGRLS